MLCSNLQENRPNPSAELSNPHSAKSAILSPMYESLTHFLKTFSAESPFLWALLVMAVIALAGLALYGFWEIVLRGVGMVIGGSAGSRGPRHGGH